MRRAPAGKAGHVLDSALSSSRARALVRNASHARPSFGCKEALYGPECCVQMSQAPTEQLYVFFTDTCPRTDSRHITFAWVPLEEGQK